MASSTKLTTLDDTLKEYTQEQLLDILRTSPPNPFELPRGAVSFDPAYRDLGVAFGTLRERDEVMDHSTVPDPRITEALFACKVDATGDKKGVLVDVFNKKPALLEEWGRRNLAARKLLHPAFGGAEAKLERPNYLTSQIFAEAPPYPRKTMFNIPDDGISFIVDRIVQFLMLPVCAFLFAIQWPVIIENQLDQQVEYMKYDPSKGKISKVAVAIQTAFYTVDRMLGFKDARPVYYLMKKTDVKEEIQSGMLPNTYYNRKMVSVIVTRKYCALTAQMEFAAYLDGLMRKGNKAEDVTDAFGMLRHFMNAFYRERQMTVGELENIKNCSLVNASFDAIAAANAEEDADMPPDPSSSTPTPQVKSGPPIAKYYIPTEKKGNAAASKPKKRTAEEAGLTLKEPPPKIAKPTTPVPSQKQGKILLGGDGKVSFEGAKPSPKKPQQKTSTSTLDTKRSMGSFVIDDDEDEDDDFEPRLNRVRTSFKEGRVEMFIPSRSQKREGEDDQSPFSRSTSSLIHDSF